LSRDGRVRTELERTVQPSLLDRLTDEKPAQPADSRTTREESVRLYRQSVQRDIAWLFNTRRSIVQVPDAYAELVASVHEYGLPDTTAIAVGTMEGQQELEAVLQEAIERFEPRLANPRVRIVDADQVAAPQVRFVVEAVLRMDPSPEAVVFDAVLEVARAEFDVRDAGAAPASR
jgi:type VI secretion system protein ImpF